MSDFTKSVKDRFPFNPSKDISAKDKDATGMAIVSAEHRDGVPEMTGNLRGRALHTMSAKTMSRKNPESGEREFLLHRGIDDDNHKHSLDGDKAVAHKQRMGYTLDPQIADMHGSAVDGASNVHHVWVPESSVISYPKAIGQNVPGEPPGPMVHGYEHEVIVHPGVYDKASSKEVENKKKHYTSDIYKDKSIKKSNNMLDKLNKIKQSLLDAKEKLEKEEKKGSLESIQAKIKAEMDKRKFGEADATRHVIDRDRGDKLPKPVKTPKPLLQSEGNTDGGADAIQSEKRANASRINDNRSSGGELCRVDSNGQWKIEKSNYGPKGYSLYNQNDNAKRKAKNTGEAVVDAGKNVNVKNYTTSGSSVSAAHEAAEAKRRKANPSPVKTLKDLSPEEIAQIGKKK